MIKTALRQHLLKTAPEEELKRWFDPLRLEADAASKEVSVHFPHAYFAAWFLAGQKDVFEEHLSAVLGQGCVVAYHYPASGPAPRAAMHLLKNESSLNYPFGHEYTFEKFLTNKRNQFPLATAREAAKSGEARFSPLLIRGKNGSGKTHLLRAIGNELAKRHDRSTIFLGSVDDLNSHYLLAHHRDFMAAREVLRKYDFLLIDDLNALARHDYLADEILYLFNTFQESKKQMVFCVTDDDSFLSGLGPTLRSRLDFGLAVTVKHPDLDIRVKYIQAKCKQYKISLTREQMLTLAQRYKEFPNLQGMLLKFQAFISLVQKHVAEGDFSRILNHEQGASDPGPTPERVIEVVGGHFGVAVKELTGPSRQKTVAFARQLALALCRDLTGLSYPALGRIFGGKDHSTVLYAVNKINKLQLSNKDTKKLFLILKEKCRFRGV
ncbi:MAG: ATP-binding protein [Desulfovibrionaceae bacterium]|nr:ATP-binding protein [Desulfovibrionaceae bacterium]MBF0512626.1 ATP-binding protein [Desulfovibrionaceae bacterium]